MTKPDMPGDVRRFILTSVPSVPYLEAILLLRTDPATAWDGKLVARRLYLAEPQAAGLLQALADAETRVLKSGGNRDRALQAAHDWFYKGPIAAEFDKLLLALGWRR